MRCAPNDCAFSSSSSVSDSISTGGSALSADMSDFAPRESAGSLGASFGSPPSSADIWQALRSCMRQLRLMRKREPLAACAMLHLGQGQGDRTRWGRVTNATPRDPG